ncbi:hypothetical protein CEK28_11420 [Xenophilus sp. AP218F]|nr:hypothetical protein CEK28_11420 [Xenophilus sp. AP218F]
MKIEVASPQHAAAYRAYFQACRVEGFAYYLASGDDADAWFPQLLRHARGEALPAGWTPCQTWFLLDDDGRIAGAARLRMGDTPEILDRFGHIGLEVLPPWRGHGYGKVLLQYVQSMGAAPASGNWVLACPADNIASIRTVEACGGQRLDEIRQPDGAILRRYSLTSLGGMFD